MQENLHIPDDNMNEVTAMTGLINIGFGNYVSGSGIISIVSPDAAPIRRLMSSFSERQKCIDATQGRKTKAVLVMASDYIVLSALTPDTIARRFHTLSQSLNEDHIIQSEPADIRPEEEMED